MQRRALSQHHTRDELCECGLVLLRDCTASASVYSMGLARCSSFQLSLGTWLRDAVRLKVRGGTSCTTMNTDGVWVFK